MFASGDGPRPRAKKRKASRARYEETNLEIWSKIKAAHTNPAMSRRFETEGTKGNEVLSHTDIQSHIS